MTNEDSDESIKKLNVKAGLKTRTLHVDYLARVEGEGALYIKAKGDQIEDVKLKIFEPPVFLKRSCAEGSFGKLPISRRGFAGYARSRIK